MNASKNFIIWAKFILKSPVMMDDLTMTSATNLLATEAGQLVSSILTSILANYELLAKAEDMSHNKERLPEDLLPVFRPFPVNERLVPGNVFQGNTTDVKEEEGDSNQNQQSDSKDQEEGDHENFNKFFLVAVAFAVVRMFFYMFASI